MGVGVLSLAAVCPSGGQAQPSPTARQAEGLPGWAEQLSHFSLLVSSFIYMYGILFVNITIDYVWFMYFTTYCHNIGYIVQTLFTDVLYYIVIY